KTSASAARKTRRLPSGDQAGETLGPGPLVSRRSPEPSSLLRRCYTNSCNSGLLHACGGVALGRAMIKEGRGGNLSAHHPGKGDAYGEPFFSHVSTSAHYRNS